MCYWEVTTTTTSIISLSNILYISTRVLTMDATFVLITSITTIYKTYTICQEFWYPQRNKWTKLELDADVRKDSSKVVRKINFQTLAESIKQVAYRIFYHSQTMRTTIEGYLQYFCSKTCLLDKPKFLHKKNSVKNRIMMENTLQIDIKTM